MPVKFFQVHNIIFLERLGRRMKISNKISNETTRKIIKGSAIAASTVVPAAYMTKFHIDLYNKNDKKRRARMANKMIGFFSGVGLSALLVHKNTKIAKAISVSKKKTLNDAVRIGIAFVAPFFGLEAAKKINRMIYPKGRNRNI